ncbi:15269_t:CDS:10, partial [Acaulospora colombiana]
NIIEFFKSDFKEEERIVTEEIFSLKAKLNNPDISSTKTKDYITRLIYCDMLGYNVEFGHIHAVKLAQSAKGLWDKRVDPEVLGVILCLFLDFVKADPNKYKDLVPVLANILEQVLDKWLPRSYDYHGVPAPWIQLKIIEIMGLLAKDDEKISLEVGPHIVHTLKKAENGVDAAFAIIFECIRSISLLHPQALSKIVNKSPHINPLNVITRFLKSHNHNLKYLGLIALSEVDTIWWAEGQWWGEDQMNVIVECLEEKDDTLKRKTLDLLYKMVNPQNVVVIVENMINALRSTSSTDELSRKLLVNRIVELLGEFSDCCDAQEKIMEKICRLLVRENDLNLLNNIIEKSAMEVDLVADESLSFLNDFVENALKNGAKPYNPIPIVHEKPKTITEIRYEAYEKPDLKYSTKSLPIDHPHYADTRLFQAEKNALSSGSGWPAGSTMTPGQLAWLGVTHDPANSPSISQDHSYVHSKKIRSYEHSVSGSQENLLEYDDSYDVR